MASQSPSASPNLSNEVRRKKTSSPTKGRVSPDHRLLPPGWEKVKSDQGAYYYWDKKTGKTSWRFPEEEAKSHQQMMKRHSYENVQLQMAAAKRRMAQNKPEEGAVTKNNTDLQPEGQAPAAEGSLLRTYVNVGTNSATLATLGGNRDLVECYGTIPPPPPAPHPREGEISPYSVPQLHPRESGITPSSVPQLHPREGGMTPSSVQQLHPRESNTETVKKRSPTPPLPERNYSETDIRMSPPPPLPQQQFSNDDVLTPPPLPARHYTASDVDLRGHGQAQPVAAAVAAANEQAQQRQDTPDHETKERSKSFDSVSDNNFKYEISEMGHQYAIVVAKGKAAARGDDKNVISPPPLPKRFRERFNEDSPFPSVSNENISQSSTTTTGSSCYVDIDHSESSPKNMVRSRSIAYAVVQIDGSAGSGEAAGKDRMPIRRAKTPRPYEDPVSASPPHPSSEIKRKSVPAYEEIEVNKTHRVDADGYTEVKHSSTLNGYAEVKRNNNGSQVLLKARTLDSASCERLPQMKQSSLDQPPLFPPLPPRPAAAATSEEVHQYQTPDVGPRSSSKVPPVGDILEGGVKSQGEVLSQDSVFDSIQRYDLPSNSRKLNAMNVTLRRNDESAAPGYSKLDLSKEALLLRSGVTLRRLNHYSLSSVSSFMRDEGSPEDEGSEVGSGTTPEAVTDEEDALEPVNKCIKSMQTSLGITDDDNQVDGNDVEPYVPMARAPTGPPSWRQFKRRPHAYEEVIQGGSQDETKSGITSSLCDTSFEASKSMSDIDMDWDNSDMGTGLERVGTSYASKAVSASQPNLLQKAPGGGKVVDGSFPHVVKPDRVSEEAFQLRIARLKQHKYEDVEDTPGVGGAGGPVGDVNELTSAVRESWLEGDKNSPPGDSKLPRGWKRLKDEEGRSYYWHVPTGRTQYARPSSEEVKRLSLQVEGIPHYSTHATPHVTQQKLKSLTFSARYLGSLDVMESELVPGQCVEVVHSCVRKLTAALSDQPSNPDQGKAVFLQVHNMELRWLNPADSSSISNVQPINRIRVWGIGLENERDFGYVARDHHTKKHKCHVFRCDVPARAIARALLENHQQREKTKTERTNEDGRPLRSSEGSPGRSMSPEMEMQHRNSQVRMTTSPTSGYYDAHGSHEHYERIECTYIGSCEVSQAMGMEILNEAVDRLSTVSHRWLNVNIDVATSNIKISDTTTNKLLFEHRVRFLCFLGIAKDDRFCGYILDGGERDREKIFIFHGFKKEPNTDRLCLALHTACQTRYKRVLDAHPEITAAKESAKERRRSKESPDRGKVHGSSNSLFGRLGSLRKIKKPVDDERCQGFVVQYCGHQMVTRQDGLEMVKEVVQQLAIPKLTSSSAAPAHLLEFDISPSGISLTDPQKKFFGRKHFSSKAITYVLRIRNYFAFVAKESGKFYCHVFLETEVDAGTIVMTIQKLLAPETSRQHKK